MKIRIHVTKEILFQTRFCIPYEEKTATSCAIAVAVRDIFPKARVEKYSIEAFGVEDEDLIRLPTEASDFIQVFDDKSPYERPP